MKKILLTILFGMIAVGSFAATVYDVYTTPYTNATGEGTSGERWYLTMKESGNVWITDLFNNTGSGTQSELLTSPTYGLTQYGYKDSTGEHLFDFTDTSRIFEGESYKYNLYKGENADKMTRNKYYLGHFEAGENVEILLSNGTNTVASNTLAGYHAQTWGRRTDALTPTMDIGQLFLPSSSQINFGIVAVGGSPIIDEGGSGTMGSPLPAPITTLLIACGFGGLVMVYRKKKGLSF